MLTFIIRRFFTMIPILIGVTLITFSIMHLSEGDPARIMLGLMASEEAIAHIRQVHGLDLPLHIQYFRRLGRIITGDFGRSIQSRRPVIEMIRDRLPATLELTITAMVLALLVGITAGIISAVRQYSWLDYSSMTFALFGVSMPPFWLGLMMMLIFGVRLGWLPISGRGDLSQLIMPAIVLSTAQMAIIARLVRSSMLEVIRQDYILTARSKGLAERIVIYKHALKNAMIPVVTMVALQLPFLFGGAVITETIFSWPGMGRMLVGSLFERDFPVIQGTVLIIAIIVMFANLLADIVYAIVDPRIRFD